MYYNLKHRRSESSNPKTLTVGNPDYSLNRSVAAVDFFQDMHNTRRAARMGQLAPLKWTEKETEKIEISSRRNGISVIRLNLAESTEANVRRNVSGQKIVHLACHGLAEDDIGQSLFSTLALTIGNPNDPKDDGFLELAEMFELDLKSCELAVLSACDTNLGPNQHGEGTWSMGRGMLASGAKRVVTANWQVADDASADLVADFIGIVNRANFPDYGTALRTAKQSIRGGDVNPVWQHPYYWAPFVLIGPN
jgi:CHAT domain-containing protein